MIKILFAEQLKLKHTLGAKLPLAAPIATFLLALFFTGGMGNALPAGAWNWWYTILLPGMLGVFCHVTVAKDKKIKFQTMSCLNFSPGKSWAGKILYCGILLLLSNALLSAMTLLGGFVFGTTISVPGSILGISLLTVSYLWAIPVCLYLSARFGMFPCVFTSMASAALSTFFLADGRYWWTLPSSYPIRLMCPTLGLLPNGLPVPQGSTLSSPQVVLPGVLLSLVWFAVLSVLTGVWFQRWEVE